MSELKDMKAKAYDIIADIERHQLAINKLSEELGAVNKEIALVYQQIQDELTTADDK